MERIVVCLTLLCVISRGALPAAPSPADVTSAASVPGAAAEPRADAADVNTSEEPPEGYYAFVESPNATPPRVRPPPYRQVAADCPEAAESKPRVTAHNLCGDLNRGTIPRNPMGQHPAGEPYPFELIRNQTLRFLSRTLPVLRADDTLPRVAHLTRPTDIQHNNVEERSSRSLELPARALPAEHRAAWGEGGAGSGGQGGQGAQGGQGGDAPRDSRKFCDGGGVFCMLYRAINGDSASSGGVERREDPGPVPAPHTHPRYEGPPTPCPARVEYATPVFARNYQGVWRYVVQIPYEGYFTQTVEVTRCMQSRCHYLEGGCLSSPRWVSLLVAEMHYPQEYQAPQYAQNRVGSTGAESDSTTGAAGGTGAATHCDGHDELGCYQVRLYYDWFLVPGSCKCWRPDYFARYVRRRHSSPDL